MCAGMEALKNTNIRMRMGLKFMCAYPNRLKVSMESPEIAHKGVDQIISVSFGKRRIHVYLRIGGGRTQQWLESKIPTNRVGDRV